jgi:hypothetical protein
MLKPLTSSVSLAVALGACSLGLAGHHGTYASEQGYPSAQCATVPSAQCETGCGPVAKKSCFSGLGNMFKHREKCYTYEWVLKKKRCGGLFGGHHNKGCETGYAGGCDTCGDVYPSAQGAPFAAPQSYGAPQAYSAPQAFGAGQMGSYGAGQAVPTTAPGTGTAPATGDEVIPPPPAGDEPADTQASNGSLLFLAPAGN